MSNNTESIPFLELFGITNKDELLTSLSNITDYLSSTGFNTNCPRSLYRYRPAKRAMDEIENHYILLASVSEMSDPYDSLIPIVDIIKKTNLYKELCEDTSDAEQMMKEILDTPKDLLTICCFAEDYRSFPMWDHYARQYTGVCIEYDGSKLKNCAAPFQVKYSKKSFSSFPKRTKNDFEFIMDSLIGSILTKNKDYCYEKEWRYFNGSFEDEIDIKDSISRVYIGAKCTRYNKQIIQTCKSNGIEVIRLKTCSSKFEFEEEIITGNVILFS
ncbi:MAG: DUF2971 domain-containing protein [Thermoplasmata archaeon]|nr:DUF2971 domain-containing protein [Thermoplasmata archaeon]